MKQKPAKIPWLYVAVIMPVILSLFFLCRTAIFNMHSTGSLYDQENIPGRAIMQGINFSSFSKGKRVMSIHIGTMRITGKKSGFLRLGFWQILRCDNVTVDLYPPASERVLAGEDIIRLVLNNNEPYINKKSDQTDQPPLACRLQHISGGNLASVKGLELHNIILNLHNERGTAFLLRSGCSEIASNSSMITFCENVLIQTGEAQRTLRAEVVKWNLSKGILAVPPGRAWMLNGHQMQNTGIKTDLKLNVLGRNMAFSLGVTHHSSKPHEKSVSEHVLLQEGGAA